MGELLGHEVKLAPDCIGDEVAKLVEEAKEGDVIMLENTRFYKEETKNEPGFVEKLAKPFDMYVNDAFGTAHRAHASTEGVTKFLKPSVSGFLLDKELKYLAGAIDHGERPMAAIVGGSKVSSKITVLEALLDKCDKIIIGGGYVPSLACYIMMDITLLTLFLFSTVWYSPSSRLKVFRLVLLW